MVHPLDAAAHLRLAAEPVAAEPFGAGHINETFLVTCATGERYVVQQLNPTVFPDPAAVAKNIDVVTGHLVGAGLVLEPAGMWEGWRAWPFVTGATSRRTVTVEEAAEAAAIFGRFHAALADLDPGRLSVTLPGFHDPARRLAALEQAVVEDPAGRAGSVGAELDTVRSFRSLAGVAADLVGRVPVRVAHNDAKVDNVLFDDATGRAVKIVDLDTLMPGPLLFDVGDLLRSGTCAAGESEGVEAGFDPRHQRTIVAAYRDETAALLTPAERDAMDVAGPIVTWQQAVRYLTDHVCGDVYYRIDHPGQNLERARNQLTLLTAMVRR